jgi:preprotein translocase SecE subunit
MASLVGGLFVLGGLAATFYLVPQFLDSAVGSGTFVTAALRLVAQVAVAAAVIWLGTRLAGTNPPHGLRGGIFLVVSWLIATFFITRAVGLNIDGPVGMGVTLVVLGGLLGLGYRLLVSPGGYRWMTAVEEQGLLHTFSYKRTQGVRMRRYTLLGILLIGWTGVYTLIAHETFGRGNWDVSIPYTGDPLKALTLLSDVQYSVPLLVAVLTFWAAWRIVNMPTFADFLIATDAEMNKVSWSSRKKLVQDTIVVLVTTLILTLFLLCVDLFWGWLLSHRWVGVLPSKTAPAGQVDPQLGKKVDW